MGLISNALYKTVGLFPERIERFMFSIYFYIKIKNLEIKYNNKIKTKKQTVLILRVQNTPERWVCYQSSLFLYKALKKEYDVIIKVLWRRNKDDILRVITKYKPDLIFLDSEDGDIQKLLEKNNVRFFGSGSKTTRTCIDKSQTNKIASENNILIPETYDYPFNKNNIKFPIIVKPCSSGSSLGVNIARTEKEFRIAIKQAKKIELKVIIQEFVNGKEYTLFVIEDKKLIIPDLIEVVNKPITYKQKYYNSKNVIKKGKLDSSERKIINQSIVLFKKLNCKDVARFDWIVKDNKPYFLEVNTIPGLHQEGKIKQVVESLGLSYNQIIQKMVSHSIKRQKNISREKRL